jgi:hypothetical protein
MNDDKKTSLGQFFLDLATDDDLLKAYFENPERAMQRYGLSTASRDVVLRCEFAAIREAIEVEFGTTRVALIVHGGGTPLPPPPPPPPLHHDREG